MSVSVCLWVLEKENSILLSKKQNTKLVKYAGKLHFVYSLFTRGGYYFIEPWVFEQGLNLFTSHYTRCLF